MADANLKHCFMATETLIIVLNIKWDGITDRWSNS